MEQIPFFTFFFESFTGVHNYQAELRADLHLSLTLILVTVALLCPIIYYFFVNSPRLLTKASWFAQLLISSFAAAGFTYYKIYSFLIPQYQLDMGEGDTGYFLKLAIAAFVIVLVLNSLFSMLFKKFSNHAGHLPF